MRHLLIKNGVAINAIEVAEDSGYQPDEGYEIVPHETAPVGSTWDGVTVTIPTDDLPEKIAAMNAAGKERALNEIRAMRTPVLNALIGIGLAAKEAGDSATVSACLLARQKLLDMTKHASVLSATDYIGTATAAAVVYAGIVAACPANVKAAFKEGKL